MFTARSPEIKAARKLIANHEHVLKDVTNPSATKNIIGVPLTQTELKRVPATGRVEADMAMQETVRRLLAEAEPPSAEEPVVWAQLATYLEGRIHDQPEQKPGRTPDMSPEAGAAMKAVLRELGGFTQASGVEGFPRAARVEAARKLIGNFDNVLLDVTNPSADQNIIGVPLTQTELKRVPCAMLVDYNPSYRAAKRGLREIAWRLLEEKQASSKQPQVWTQVSGYLQGRIHDEPEQKPGREPDMTAEEGGVMKRVLQSVGDGSPCTISILSPMPPPGKPTGSSPRKPSRN